MSSFDAPTGIGLAAQPLIRAAQYVRMSTDNQKYSIMNQIAAIDRYAAANGMQVVRTYADAGKSGLRIANRLALLQLLEDVQEKRTDYEVLIVYDVSRWGRFQDADEGAFYEYLCRRAGLRVIYCAEQFKNDGSALTAIMKSIKRAMAAEFSRELAMKVLAGQIRRVELGFHVGSLPSLGLRRMVVSHKGVEKGVLNRGELKHAHSDYIVLVPGPPEEVETVRRIFRMFADDRMPETQIAEVLNAEGVLNGRGRKWIFGTVRNLLRNEKYIGNIVFNRTSNPMRARVRRNPEDKWITVEGAFEAIVPRPLFDRAQAIFESRVSGFNKPAMLAALAALLKRKGRLSHNLINADADTLCCLCYRKAFGSVFNAYQLVGFQPRRNTAYLDLKRGLQAQIAEGLRARDFKVEPFGRSSFLINDYWSILVVVAWRRPAPYREAWRTKLELSKSPTITVVVRMSADRGSVHDYLFLPPELRRQHFYARTGDYLFEPYRHDNLSALFDLFPFPAGRGRSTHRPARERIMRGWEQSG